jgi:hypothetical protein
LEKLFFFFAACADAVEGGLTIGEVYFGADCETFLADCAQTTFALMLLIEEQLKGAIAELAIGSLIAGGGRGEAQSLRQASHRK